MNKLLSASLSIAGTAAAIALTTSASHAASFTVLGNSCPGGTCGTLQQAGYTVSGGGVVNPAQTTPDYKTPGTNNETSWDPTDTSSQVTAYNVTSSKNSPSGATTPITISNLQGVLSFLWGSVDTYNKISFDDGSSFTGTDIATVLGLTPPKTDAGNYKFDAFVKFTGNFTSAVLEAVENPTFTGDEAKQIAFEVAAPTSVPEANGVSTLLLIGAVAGGLALKNRFQQA
jgi:hypothetical protein